MLATLADELESADLDDMAHDLQLTSYWISPIVLRADGERTWASGAAMNYDNWRDEIQVRVS